MSRPVDPLPVKALRWHCDPTAFAFSSTKEIEPIHGVIGQQTAVEALSFGLEIHAPGQNVFVRGLTGTGRMTLISRLLQEIKPSCPDAKDRCYVHNFSHPDRPRLITLNRGQAPAFRRRINELADFIRDDLASALTSETSQAQLAVLRKRNQEQVDVILKPFQQALEQAGLGLVTIQLGPVSQAALLPLVDGKPVPLEEWEHLHASGKITDDEYGRVNRQREQYEQKLDGLMAKVNEVREHLGHSLRSLREQTTRAILSEFSRKIEREFPEPGVGTFLGELIEDVAMLPLEAVQNGKDPTRLYRVNVLRSDDEQVSCPVVVENTPTIMNLLGTVDYKSEPGQGSHSDHLMITAGSLLRSDGGYLILEARDILRESGAWKVLLRTIRTGRLEIVPPDFAYPRWIPSLKPEPIDINVKVVLLGDSEIYYLLDAYDPDFPNLFKVLADFDSVIPNDESGFKQYAGVLARIIKEENLLHFDRGAVAALVERGARIANRQDKLTTRFGRLADYAREASFIARKASRTEVSAEDVKTAIRSTKDRADLPSKRFRELLSEGTIRISVTGSEIGQINGLAMIQAGPLTYGFPARITATIGPGTAGMINIEREAELSGALHTKGFYILGGLLRHLLRTEHPLAFHASVAFEQTYGGIDGDSASAAEICCLFSALTEIPLRQDLAMTGAIDQIGNVLAVGAVNEKIEGFFDTCRDLELTGTQGVVIPKANARDLMLRDDLVDACQRNLFHVYAIDKIHEALELLMGTPAGESDAEGNYPEGSVLGLAVEKALEYWLRVAPTVIQADQEADAGDSVGPPDMCAEP